MGKRVLIITSSFRKNSNSEALALSFAKGASESGNSVEVVNLSDKKLNFCIGCMSCQHTGRCFMRDDADVIEQKMLVSDVLVFATPIYYYEMSGQMKTMLDRGNPLYSSDYKFRDVYLLTTAADDAESTPLRAQSGLEGWIECFPKASLKGTVFCGGVTDPGEINGNPALDKAFEMGKNV